MTPGISRNRCQLPGPLDRQRARCGPSAGLEVERHLTDQELALSYAYWQGVVRVEGKRDGQAISGDGYVEVDGLCWLHAGQF